MPTIRTYEVVISFEIYRPEKQHNLGWQTPCGAVTCDTVEELHGYVGYHVSGRVRSVTVHYPMLFDDPKITVQYTILRESVESALERITALRKEVKEVVEDLSKLRHDVLTGTIEVAVINPGNWNGRIR